MQRMRKSVLCLLLAVILTLTASACQKAPQPGTDGGPASSQTGVTTDREGDEFSTDSGSETEISGTETTDGNTSASDPDTDLTSDTDSASQFPSDTQTPDTTSTQSTQSTRPSGNTSSQTTDTGSASTSTFVPATEPQDIPSGAVNTNVSAIVPKDYYGRKWLSAQTNGANLVKVYDEIAAGVEQLKNTVEFSVKLRSAEFLTVWECYRADYAEHFWLGNEYQYSYDNHDKVHSVSPAYTMSKAQASSGKAALEQKAKSLLNGIGKNMTQYQIEKTIHDRLILNTVYVESANAHNAYGAIVEGKAVCEGFARAFEYLCRSVGIETLMVYGSSYNPASGAQESHAWNIAKIDGNYYHVDVTWDNTSEPDATHMHYAWFNVSTSVIREDHVMNSDGYPYPECTATECNYFKKTNGELNALTVDGITSHTVKNGDEFFTRIYLLSNEDAIAWLDRNAGELAKIYGLNGYQYSVVTVGRETDIIMTKY